MGKKDKKTPVAEEEKTAEQEEKPAEEAVKPTEGAEKADNKEPAEEEDPPVVKELKAVDDKYLELEKQFEKERQAVRRKYEEKQLPLLQERRDLLRDTSTCEGGAPKYGTPALRGFWLKAMRNCRAFEDQIESWDDPVLEYLVDVTAGSLDAEDAEKGFKLTFHFDENPYFTNETIWKEFHLDAPDHYTGEVTCRELKASEIEWKEGKDVTVEVVKKKVKGGGAKKAKQKAKESVEPRDSFFRHFVRSLKEGDPLPEDVNLETDDYDYDEDTMTSAYLDDNYQRGLHIKESLVPFAVRWYTGEAKTDDDEEEDDDDEDDEEEDADDEDDDDEDDEPPPKSKGKQQPKKGGGGGAAPGAGSAKPEECKQQ